MNSTFISPDRINCTRFHLVFVAIILTLAGTISAQTNTFTYQGRLTDNNLAAVGTYEMQFRVFDAAVAGNQLPVGTPVTLNFTVAGTNPVTVSNGAFTVQLNFGAGVFTGADRWLDISVRKPSDPPGFTLLTPRQPITSSPYAIKTINANAADSVSAACNLCITDAQISGIDGGKVTGVVANAATAGTAANSLNLGGVPASGYLPTSGGTVTGALTVNGILSGNGSGLTNLPSSSFPWLEVTGTSQQALTNNGYVANNYGEVTITLPASPNVGDTIRVTGAGVGGWRIAQGVGQSVFAPTFGTVGAVWTPRDSSRSWVSVASSADGSKLIAATGNGKLYTSTDSGVTWVPRDSDRFWFAVASSYDGTKLVAVTNPGQIYTSTDSGVTWIPRESTRPWTCVASSADGTKLVAGNTAQQLYTSTDSGVTWTPRESNRSWWSVASSADGTKLVAGGLSQQIFTSTDSGVTWTPRHTVGFWDGLASSADGTKLVAASAGAAFYTSTNSGVTWTQHTTPQLKAVASSADGRKLIGAASTGLLYVSIDSGTTWISRESTRSWQSVASSADGNNLVAVAGGGFIYTSNLLSTVGVTGYVTGPKGSSVELQYVGGGNFQVISHEGTITSH